MHAAAVALTLAVGLSSVSAALLSTSTVSSLHPSGTAPALHPSGTVSALRPSGTAPANNAQCADTAAQSGLQLDPSQSVDQFTQNAPAQFCQIVAGNDTGKALSATYSFAAAGSSSSSGGQGGGQVSNTKYQLRLDFQPGGSNKTSGGVGPTGTAPGTARPTVYARLAGRAFGAHARQAVRVTRSGLGAGGNATAACSLDCTQAVTQMLSTCVVGEGGVGSLAMNGSNAVGCGAYSYTLVPAA